MQVITQPDDGLTPILKAIKRARKSLDIVIFRFDLPELEDALAAAVERGVAVRALIAHTNRGGEKKLRKLESRLLKCGATLSRTADDMVRYHGKVIIVDNKTAMVLGFNFTSLDIKKSRSLGLITANPKIVVGVDQGDRRRSQPGAADHYLVAAGGQPGERARTTVEVHQGRAPRAVDLRQQRHRRSHHRAADAARGRRREGQDSGLARTEVERTPASR